MSFEDKNKETMTKINELIKTQGIKAKYICQQLNIDAAYFSQWRKGKKYLGENSLESLDAYLLKFKNF